MATSEPIREIQRRTVGHSLDARRALPGWGRDTGRPTDWPGTARFATKSMCVTGSEIAARLAAQLIGTGLWFECEQLDREKWLFTVAPGGCTRLIALHGMLLCSRDAR